MAKKNKQGGRSDKHPTGPNDTDGECEDAPLLGRRKPVHLSTRQQRNLNEAKEKAKEKAQKDKVEKLHHNFNEAKDVYAEYLTNDEDAQADEYKHVVNERNRLWQEAKKEVDEMKLKSVAKAYHPRSRLSHEHNVAASLFQSTSGF